MATVQRVSLDTLRPEVTCRVCDSSRHFEYLHARGYRIVECLECGDIFESSELNAMNIEDARFPSES